MLDNNSDVQQREKTIEELKEYYISMEKMCCALEVGCVTEKMKTQYREILGFNADETSKKMEEIFLKAFPDAMEIIMH
jgi:hypothetical protein